jgi:hypothetical protein
VKNITSRVGPETSGVNPGTFWLARRFREREGPNVKEVRAVVLGLLVIVLVTIAIAVWRRPARELKHLGGFKVEIEKSDAGARRRHVSFHVPIALIARLTSLVPFREFGGDFRTDWGNGELSAKDILDAAAASAPGKPGEIKREHERIEVTADLRSRSSSKTTGTRPFACASPGPWSKAFPRKSPSRPERSCGAWTSSAPETSSSSETATTRSRSPPSRGRCQVSGVGCQGPRL